MCSREFCFESAGRRRTRVFFNLFVYLFIKKTLTIKHRVKWPCKKRTATPLRPIIDRDKLMLGFADYKFKNRDSFDTK